MGYFGKDAITQSEFHAVLADNARQSNGSTASDGYLRSGDLGFLNDGELYICGRLL
jgi:acyl-CoA synthetase (AMP-forming)/AMP-acid ligase II